MLQEAVSIVVLQKAVSAITAEELCSSSCIDIASHPPRIPRNARMRGDE